MAIERRIGESFTWEGHNLTTVIADGKGCTRCFFNRTTDEKKSEACIQHVCEHDRRIDSTDVKFVTEKKGA